MIFYIRFLFKCPFIGLPGLSCSTWVLHCFAWGLFAGIEPGPTALGAWSHSHWTTGNLPLYQALIYIFVIV